MLSKVDRIFPGYIFDLDGTIWMTDELVPGAQQAVRDLRELGSRVVFLTNNSDGTREMFAAQLTEMGIEVSPEEIVSTSYVMARYLNEQAPGCHCYVIGADPVREELQQAGLQLSDRPGEVRYVVLGIDRDFTYRKLQIAFESIRAGALFVATNPDPYVPTSHGDLPDIGALIAAIEVSSGHPLDMLVGKPSSYIVEIALEKIGLARESCLMVGDQLGTDVLAAHKTGVPVALLLRDPHVVIKLKDWPDKPDYVINDLRELNAAGKRMIA
jgi:arabinose operon protein AraL